MGFIRQGPGAVTATAQLQPSRSTATEKRGQTLPWEAENVQSAAVKGVIRYIIKVYRLSLLKADGQFLLTGVRVRLCPHSLCPHVLLPDTQAQPEHRDQLLEAEKVC